MLIDARNQYLHAVMIRLLEGGALGGPWLGLPAVIAGASDLNLVLWELKSQSI